MRSLIETVVWVIFIGIDLGAPALAFWLQFS
jgi:hypothetical protein